jgi:hypothetical protein
MDEITRHYFADETKRIVFASPVFKNDEKLRYLGQSTHKPAIIAPMLMQQAGLNQHHYKLFIERLYPPFIGIQRCT